MTVELEILNEYRFYKLQAIFPQRCTYIIENIYCKVDLDVYETRTCNGLLNLNMKDDSINMRCPHVDCHAEYDITRVCNVCGLETIYEDTTCDNCEPRVINIATWQISIAESNKSIKKVNRAFKQDIIKEEVWKLTLELAKSEILKCEKLLENEELYSQSTN